jgi:hypothetical protein
MVMLAEAAGKRVLGWLMCGKATSIKKKLLKPSGFFTLGRTRRRWEDNTKMDIQEVGGGCGDWMERAQEWDRWRAFVTTVMNFRVS